MICVGLTTVYVVAAVVPKSTAVTHWNSVPVIVTVVPPPVGPVFGTTPVTVGTELMSGPVAPHTLWARVITPPPSSAERRVITTPSTVIPVLPGELTTTCLLISTLSKEDSEAGRAGIWSRAEVTGIGVPPITRLTTVVPPVEPVALD